MITIRLANIDDVKVVEKDSQHYRIIFKLQVHNRKHLAKIIRNLRGIENVVKVMRKSSM